MFNADEFHFTRCCHPTQNQKLPKDLVISSPPNHQKKRPSCSEILGTLHKIHTLTFFPVLPTVCPRARNSQHGDMCIYVFVTLIMYLENSLSSFVSIARACDGPQPLPRRKSLLDSGSSLTCQASGGSWRMETIQVQRESRQTVEIERMRLEQIIDYSRWTARWIDRQTDRLTDRQTERETERQRQRQSRQRQRQTDRYR